jgi:pantoate--beta-alanine ligase
VQTIIARSLKTLKQEIAKVKSKKKIGLVPTMGCLHDGHLALIKKAKKLKCFTVVSIFVNPIQFNNKNDLKKYPSQEKEDIILLKKYNVDLIFIPKKNQIYPQDYSTYINETKHSKILCGKHRENHFAGVLTIVLKLFTLVKPYIAFFGEKDFQQLLIIKKMVKDFNLGIKISRVATVRDNHGLALSSRNNLLSSDNLKKAREIYAILKKSDKRKFKYSKELVNYLKKELSAVGLKNIEYLEIRQMSNLKEPIKLNLKSEIRIFIALQIGGIRLIDNYKIK